ncbi:uncharacterized protein IUM83_12891 [Phytophthora cinnamomi]|uniref:uncharacterized protein n=1 Tax=Phytophthora cinnamomi TaxID=4785 RepID=UPI00355A512A|nr:hypothetical protein IUM83_12891 [Phytophthora cinnamomi]
MFEEAGRRRRQGWGGSGSSDDASSWTPSLSTQQSDEDAQPESKLTPVTLSDEEMLERARAAHNREDFTSLSAGPEANGPWRRVDTVDRFVVFRREVVESNNDNQNDLDVLCAGRLDASIEEVASILRSSSEVEHNASMTALYAKSFIFGSYEREVYCCQYPRSNQTQDDSNSGEQLTVKTKSFARTTMLGRNEQWCYFDYFQRKKERDGFTISKRALLPSESVPGRITGENARVDQLHGMNASYLVDKLPNRKGLRVVLHAWFDQEQRADRARCSPQSVVDVLRRRQSSDSSSNSSPGSLLHSKSLEYRDANKHKAQMRRLLAIANGVTNLPELIRRRRFGFGACQTVASEGSFGHRKQEYGITENGHQVLLSVRISRLHRLLARRANGECSWPRGFDCRVHPL